MIPEPFGDSRPSPAKPGSPTSLWCHPCTSIARAIPGSGWLGVGARAEALQSTTERRKPRPGRGSMAALNAASWACANVSGPVMRPTDRRPGQAREATRCALGHLG